MRNFLVTNFRCGTCGRPLGITYDEPKIDGFITDGITGADKVEKTIFVLPCAMCLKPAREAKEAVKKLMSL